MNDHPDALRVLVTWKTSVEPAPHIRDTTVNHGYAHPDWPTACDHMRRLIDIPGVYEVSVRRGC